VILYMGAVPAMDVTGLVALESAIEKLQQRRTFVVIAGVQEQPAQVLAKAGITDDDGRLAVCDTVEEAIELAKTRRRPTTEIEIQGPAALQ
jgi:SulP family sulfate permease